MHEQGAASGKAREKPRAADFLTASAAPRERDRASGRAAE
jgi:hypothetical protein